MKNGAGCVSLLDDVPFTDALVEIRGLLKQSAMPIPGLVEKVEERSWRHRKVSLYSQLEWGLTYIHNRRSHLNINVFK